MADRNEYRIEHALEAICGLALWMFAVGFVFSPSTIEEPIFTPSTFVSQAALYVLGAILVLILALGWVIYREYGHEALDTKEHPLYIPMMVFGCLMFAAAWPLTTLIVLGWRFNSVLPDRYRIKLPPPPNGPVPADSQKAG